jgi:hypothetical protein
LLSSSYSPVACKRAEEVVEREEEGARGRRNACKLARARMEGTRSV